MNDYAVIGQEHDLPCGSLLPNCWGIFDMLGNSWEMTYERYAYPQTVEALSSGPRDQDGVIRGGTAYTRPGFTQPRPRDDRRSSVGFRVVFSDGPIAGSQ